MLFLCSFRNWLFWGCCCISFFSLIHSFTLSFFIPICAFFIYFYFSTSWLYVLTEIESNVLYIFESNELKIEYNGVVCLFVWLPIRLFFISDHLQNSNWFPSAGKWGGATSNGLSGVSYRIAESEGVFLEWITGLVDINFPCIESWDWDPFHFIWHGVVTTNSFDIWRDIKNRMVISCCTYKGERVTQSPSIVIQQEGSP